MNLKTYFGYAALLMVLLTTISACKKVPEREGTTVEKLAGEWYVRIDNKPKRYSIQTYNTAANTAELWLETAALRDEDNANERIGVKGKIPVQLSAQTFSGTGVENILGTTEEEISEFDVVNGKVITNGTFGVASRTPADSIYFEVKVNGKTFKVSGFHRTGFQVDEP